MSYEERLKHLNLYSIQRRRDRYQIIYLWTIIEKFVKLHNAEAKTSWANAVKMGLESTNSIKAVQAAVTVNHPESTKTNSVERKMTLNLFICSSIKAYKLQNNQFSLVSDLVDIPKIKLDLSRFCLL